MAFYQKRFGKEAAANQSFAVHLNQVSSRLILLARALTGENIEVTAAEMEGGLKNNQFYLPSQVSLFPSVEKNLQFYLFRTAYLAVQFAKRTEMARPYPFKTLEEARHISVSYSSPILADLKKNYWSAYHFYESILPFFEENNIPRFWLFGKHMSDHDVSEHDVHDAYDHEKTGSHSLKVKTEIRSKAVEEAEVIKVDKKSQEDYVMTHNFEKVETAEEFSGVWRGFDGDDTLQEDADALNELNLKHLVRTDEVAESIYQADFRDLSYIPESSDVVSSEPHFIYDEWNAKKSQYKKKYCKVFIKGLPEGDLNFAKDCLSKNTKTLNALRRKFAQINQKRREVKRLPDGERIDIDALADWFSDIRSGITPSENIYYGKRKKDSDLAILFLLDLSLSTDSYADGYRVLDVEKEAVILFGEVMTDYHVDFAIGGFYSKTRNNCAYLPIKNFSDDWDRAKNCLGNIQPKGYTRIGPALRHAKALIENHAARDKWVILLSDGKPNDYDKYEGKYGIADVKQSLKEMYAQRINSYAIAIESRARYYLPQMFGQNHYTILSHPEMLIDSLSNLYRRIQNH